jgi:hypothetical protein
MLFNTVSRDPFDPCDTEPKIVMTSIMDATGKSVIHILTEPLDCLGACSIVLDEEGRRVRRSFS